MATPNDKASAPQTKAQRRETMRLELEQRVAAQKRRRLLSRAIVIVAALAVVVTVVSVIGVRQHRAHAPTEPSAVAPQAVVDGITKIPASVFDTVGAGTGVSDNLRPLPHPAPSVAGKPRFLYIGAEYCPFCAAERWPVVAALSRFGTFSGLGETASSPFDISPNTASVSFHGSAYQSKHLAFAGYEIQGNQPQGRGFAPLDELSAADATLERQYNLAQYTGAQRDHGLPFLLIGGKVVQTGASYDPAILKGLSQEQIATKLSDPSDPVTQAILGSANALTATICDLTGQQPRQVCTSPGVRAAARS